MYGAPNSLHGNLRSVYSDEAFFGIYSSEEVKNMSVVKIVTTNSFNVLGHPLPGGLYDPRLGPCDRMLSCTTCGWMAMKCPGHTGHIELPFEVINPLFHKRIFEIISISCLQCHHVLLPPKAKSLLQCQLRLLDAGFIVEAANVESHIIGNDNSCSDNESPEIFFNFLTSKLDQYIESLKQSQDKSDCKARLNQSFKSYDQERSSFFKLAFDQVKKNRVCPLCKYDTPILTFSGNKILSAPRKRKTIEGTDLNKSTDGTSKSFERVRSGQVFLSPTELKDHLKSIWTNDKRFIEELIPVLKRSPCSVPTDIIFLDAILVTPSAMRPFNIVRNSPVEHPNNTVYKSILANCFLLKSILFLANPKDDETIPEEIISITNRARGLTVEEKLQTAWHELQSNVDILLLGKVSSGNHVIPGLKQVIEKKEGIIRMNMMGKRVNFAARSVITPDPNIDINEIGFPEPFAKVLTYPVPVTPWNVVELRELVKNGPMIYPGAVAIVNENGTVHRISDSKPVERESLAKRLLTPEETAKGGKVVLRHLMNGDILLANRQPTLHKPSIMAHKARILKGEKTLRLHYANCKAYNADFDGDEMNTHFAQNEVARSEAYSIVNSTKQYLVPKDGTPLSGLIQDHVIGAVHLTTRGSFFDRVTYMHLVYQALSFIREPIKVLPPCMIKPKALWSGKQVVSTVIINLTPRGKFPLNLNSSSKIPVKAWAYSKLAYLLKNPKTMSESEVIIRNGQLLSGVIDKTHCGATSYGLVHSFYELYGGEASSRLLSSFSKLFTCVLQLEGFTLDVKDILVKPKADEERSKIIEEVRSIGSLVAACAMNLPPDTDPEAISKELEISHQQIPNFRAIVDREYKSALDALTNSINSTCLPRGLLEEFPRNNLQLMVQSGAKGSTVNTMQISCLLGQIELEGKRPPLMTSGRSLPSFKPYDTSPRAGGFIDGRFMTGIQPQEFFFHCMAGREGLIDTAVKTSRSGYLQRCLIKHLEGLVVNYDMTVRDSDGSVIQFLYGEDGLDVCKSQYFKPNLLQFLEKNVESVVDKACIRQFKKQAEVDQVIAYMDKVKLWRRRNRAMRSKKQRSFVRFSADMKNSLRNNAPGQINPAYGRSYLDLLLCKKWEESDRGTKERYQDSNLVCPDPALSRYAPGSYFGSISEKLDEIVENYIENSLGLSKGRQKIVRDMVNYKALVSICPPGEPVGILAAQSIGEPSTQMTLNTFHFAGRGEMNVTLGVPRLREILTVATKKLKTPCVDVPFLPCDTPKKLEKRAEKLKKNMMKITLEDVLEYINVSERLDLEPHRHLVYELHMQFLPCQAYKDKTNVKPNEILKHVEKYFLRELQINIMKVSKIKAAFTHENFSKSNKTTGNENGEEEEKDEEGAKVVGKKKLDLDSDSSGSENEGDEEDATVSKRRTQQQEQQYDEPEEGEKEAPADEDDILAPEQDDSAEVQDREFNVCEQYQFVSEYKYDTVDGQWCKVTLWLPLSCQHMDFSSMIRKIASSSVIYEIPNIKRAITYENDGRTFLKTDGINLSEMFSYCDTLDINKLYSNDIHCVAEKYGIEAAARVIVKEVQNVFQVYGITVDPRHLLLVADYMTYDGTYSPMNRKGIEKNSSPIQQMSFECSLNFLKNAALQGKADLLQSPSSRIFVGKHCRLGTGMMDVLIKT
ncbi:unnamed protein product [Bemisia tabaci]|uniref:DNA-directed RNA polymerase subunit n=1 Tax=Bemisia tabaci TaxID=7038 RepID=A0A9P0F7D1_BEMTA|nr:unnamed protein product [Bemisia tabaci]